MTKRRTRKVDLVLSMKHWALVSRWSHGLDSRGGSENKHCSACGKGFKIESEVVDHVIRQALPFAQEDEDEEEEEGEDEA